MYDEHLGVDDGNLGVEGFIGKKTNSIFSSVLYNKDNLATWF